MIEEEFEIVGGGKVNADGEKVKDEEEKAEKKGQEIIKKAQAEGKDPVEILAELNKKPEIETTGIITGDGVSHEAAKKMSDFVGKHTNPKLILTKEDVDGFVVMQGAYDSGIACVAMAARKDYKDIAPCIPRSLKSKFKDVPGSGRIALQPHEMMRLLYDFGILARQVTCLNLFKDHPAQGWRATHANALYEYSIQDLQQYIFLGGKALLGVPGHEDKNMMHWIYCEGATSVHDPYPIKADRYKSLSRLMIADAIIVGGVPSGAK